MAYNAPFAFYGKLVRESSKELSFALPINQADPDPKSILIMAVVDHRFAIARKILQVTTKVAVNGKNIIQLNTTSFQSIERVSAHRVKHMIAKGMDHR